MVRTRTRARHVLLLFNSFGLDALQAEDALSSGS
jgi:hypothetical protein